MTTFLLQIVDGIELVHNKGGVHLDLKFDNIFLSINQEGKCIPVIGDTGLALPANSSHPARGTVDYWPPEIAHLHLHQSNSSLEYKTSFDIWSLGTIFFVLLHPNFRPLTFQHQEISDKETMRIISNLEDENLKLEIDRSIINVKYHPLLKGMLQIDPDKRWTIDQIKKELGTIQTSGTPFRQFINIGPREAQPTLINRLLTHLRNLVPMELPLYL